VTGNINVMRGTHDAHLLPHISNNAIKFKELSFKLQVAYTPAAEGGGSALSKLTLNFPDAEGRNHWQLTPVANTPGEYTVKTKAGVHSGIYYGLDDMTIDLNDTDLAVGDKITVTASDFKYDFYKGITNDGSPENMAGTARAPDAKVWTYTIAEPYEKVEAYRVGEDIDRAVSMDQPATVLYSFHIRNSDVQGGEEKVPVGSISTPKTIEIEMQNPELCGVSPAYMVLPAASGHTVQSITYTSAATQNVERTITGSWTGGADHSITVTLNDFPVLSETDYIKSLSYDMGSLPKIGYPSTPYYLCGQWLDEDSSLDTKSKIKITITNTDSADTLTGYPHVYEDISNRLAHPSGDIITSNSSGFEINAGNPADFKIETIRSSGDVVVEPVFYIRNPSGGRLDPGAIKLEQSYGGAGDITDLFEINDITAAGGVPTYKIQPNSASVGNHNIWMGTPAYMRVGNAWVSEPQLEHRITVSWRIETDMWEPASTHRMGELFLISSANPNYVMTRGNGAADAPAGGFGLPAPLMAPGYNFKILPYQQIAYTVESKRTDQGADAYAPAGDYTLDASSHPTESVSLRATLFNPSGQEANEVTFIIPIPKKRENWGNYSDNKAFPFSMNLNGELRQIGAADAFTIQSGATDAFTIMYGNKVTPGKIGEALATDIGWEVYNAEHRENYNAVKITAEKLAYNAGETNEERQANNTFVFEFDLSIPYSDDITDDMTAAWTAVLFSSLGDAGSPYSAWTNDARIIVSPQLGDIAGVYWLDGNKDGRRDSGENGLTGKADRTVYLLDGTEFDENDEGFKTDPVAYFVSKGAKSAVTDENGAYSFTLLDRNAAYALLATNGDVTSYRFSPLGADMKFGELSVISGEGSNAGKTIYPAALVKSATPGLNVAETKVPDADGKGIYDVGLTAQSTGGNPGSPGGSGGSTEQPQTPDPTPTNTEEPEESETPDDTEEPEQSERVPNPNAGGNDPNVPPVPGYYGSTLVPGENGTFIEIGEDGTPLGEWHWEPPPVEQWIFEEFPPLGNLPQTGATGAQQSANAAVCMILLLLTLAGAAIGFGARRRSKEV
jgi:hypothetical protein